jgi:hypothetical protein
VGQWLPSLIYDNTIQHHIPVVFDKWLALFDVIITISIYFTYMVTTKYNWGRSYTDKTPVIGKGLHTYITTCKGRHRGANTTGMW